MKKSTEASLKKETDSIVQSTVEAQAEEKKTSTTARLQPPAPTANGKKSSKTDVRVKTEGNHRLNPPAFYYFPSNEELTNLILKEANITL